jgi:hypothetical protein
VGLYGGGKAREATSARGLHGKRASCQLTFLSGGTEYNITALRLVVETGMPWDSVLTHLCDEGMFKVSQGFIRAREGVGDGRVLGVQVGSGRLVRANVGSEDGRKGGSLE